MAKEKSIKENDMTEQNGVCKSHSGIVSDVKQLKEDTKEQWTEINKIKNRPPVWCTAVIALLTGLLGSVITYAALAVRLSQVAHTNL